MFEIQIREAPVVEAKPDQVSQQGDQGGLADRAAVVRAAVQNYGLSEVEAGLLWTYKKFRRNNTIYTVTEVPDAADKG